MRDNLFLVACRPCLSPTELSSRCIAPTAVIYAMLGVHVDTCHLQGSFVVTDRAGGGLSVHPFRLIWHPIRQCTAPPCRPPVTRFGLGSHTCLQHPSWGSNHPAFPLSVYSLVRVKIPTIHHHSHNPPSFKHSLKPGCLSIAKNTKRPVNSADSQP